MTATEAAHTFVELPAAPEQVWDALTTDEGLAPWMGEGAWLIPEAGGAAAFPDPVGGRHRAGRVEQVEPGRLLTYTWWPADDADDVSSVAIELTPSEAGTRVDVTETRAFARATSATCSTGSSALWTWRSALLVVAYSLVTQ